MSKLIEDMDFDNLTADEEQYLRDRPWLPQPPGDEAESRGPNDWNEDDHEVVSVAGASTSTGEPDGGSEDGPRDEDGDPITLDDDGDFAGYDWERMKVARLKEFLTEYELPVSGNKTELVARLHEYDELVAAQEADAGTEGS